MRSEVLLVLAALIAMPASGQIAAPNERGVAMGHLHFHVEDVVASRRFWLSLGGTAVDTPQGPAISLPGVLVMIQRGQILSSNSPVDHVAFRVASLAELRSRGIELELLEAYPGIATVGTPAGESVELFEEGTATNVGFDSATATPVSERHNQPLVGAIDSHHLHFYLPEEDVPAARDWYVEYFGAVPGMRWRYDAADLPGMNLNFSAARTSDTGAQLQSFHHIGFEVAGLEAFCESLTQSGLVFDQEFTRISDSFAVAILTDPWGVSIELTEGLVQR